MEKYVKILLPIIKDAPAGTDLDYLSDDELLAQAKEILGEDDE